MGSLGLLNWVYLALLSIGFIVTLFTLLGQGIGDIGALGVDLDAGDVPSFDQGEVGLSSISPMSIASFVTAFGAFGLISTQLFDASAGTSLIFAVAGGLAVGLFAQLLFIFVFSPQTSSLRTQKDVIGSTAEVTTPIPANGVGQIALVARGVRATYSARSRTGQVFERGEVVRVVELVGSVAFVESR